MRLEGVCDHAPDLCTEEVDRVVRVGVCGGVVAFASFALDVRVARLRGEDELGVAVADSGSGKSLGWFRVATMLATLVV